MPKPSPDRRRDTSGRLPRLLLINPRFPESFWSFRWALQDLLPYKRAINPPLGLATVAALTPDNWEVSISDENIEALPIDPDVDIIGIGGMAVQYSRQRELLDYYREQGYYVVAGGSFASLSPESYVDHVDSIVVGEAENTWPQFCSDFQADLCQDIYKESGWISLEDSPTPRFDLLKLDRYTTASIQFSRGCPYQCEFCDIPLLFGRKPRTKTLEQIGLELDALHAAGASNVFFVDDNLIGHQPRARTLLEFLSKYQQERSYPFTLGTAASVNLATNASLLQLFRTAGFQWVFLGIETPDTDSLAEAGKTQNLKTDLLDAVHNFYRNGINVFSGFIIGFDHDTTASFSRLYRFIVDSGIQVAMLGLLTAVPKTPLYKRLESEGRLRHDIPPGDNTGGKTNVIPLNMSYPEMISGYDRIYRDLCSNRAIAARIRNKLRHFTTMQSPGSRKEQDSLALASRLLVRGILPGGPSRIVAFIWSMARFRPHLWSTAMQDWAHALSIRAYALRHIGATRERENKRLMRAIKRITSRLQNSQGAKNIELVMERVGKRRQLRIIVQGWLLTDEAQIIARIVRRFMARTPTVPVAVQLRESHSLGYICLHELIAPLRRYADRITIESNLSLLPYLDSSVFRISAPIDSS